MSEREIERKFLLRRPPDGYDEYRGASIEQGYLAVADDGTEVRVRRQDGRFTQTIKRGSGLNRAEVEISLDRAQFEALWPLTEDRRLSKTRTRVPCGALTVEIDRYDGTLAGLWVAEIEFASEEAGRAFDPPDWLGAEVTDDERYKNRRLALDGLPDEPPSLRARHAELDSASPEE